MHSAQERPLSQAYAPCGCEARGHAYGADGWARTNDIHSTWRSNRLSYVCMRGVLVFPSRQIFSVPRFCQQITGAITTSRLEGLTSGLRITHTAVPLNARHLRCPRRIGADGWTRTNDIPPGAVLYRLSYVCGCVPRHIPLWRRGGSLVLLWRWVTPFSRQPRRFSRCPIVGWTGRRASLPCYDTRTRTPTGGLEVSVGIGPTTCSLRVSCSAS